MAGPYPRFAVPWFWLWTEHSKMQDRVPGPIQSKLAADIALQICLFGGPMPSAGIAEIHPVECEQNFREILEKYDDG